MLYLKGRISNPKFSVTNTQIERNRWKYTDGNIYYDSEIIITRLKEIIIENNIKSYADIPNDIKNIKMLSYKLISPDDIKDISREKVIINGIELYVLKSYVPEIAQSIVSNHFNVKYDYKVAIEENRQLLKDICSRILNTINEKHNYEFEASDNEFNNIKTFIQFYKHEWNSRKKGVHFEILSNSKRWFDNVIDLNLVLHIEKSTDDEIIEKLNKDHISRGENEDDPYLAYLDHVTPIFKSISKVCIKNNNDQIVNTIINQFIELIDEYTPIIDKAFKKDNN